MESGPSHLLTCQFGQYFWGAMGLVICAIPVFSGSSAVEHQIADAVRAVNQRSGSSSRTDFGVRTEAFVTNRRLLLSSSDAFGRIMYSYKGALAPVLASL